MTILEYYKASQTDNNWVQEYQSTAQDKHGKIFNCLNVNFRSLKAYYNQLEAFKSKDGLKRSEWNDYQDNGQEKDKHRIQALKNAKFIRSEGERFFITPKGKVALKINEDESLSEKDKWLLIYMLLIDFEFDGRELDIVKSVLDITTDLEEFGIKGTTLITYLKDLIRINDKLVFFKKDIFWIITFYKDKKFIELFLKSNKKEKEELFEWVINCSKNKNSSDCIAHKFVSGGAYTGSMFNEDVNMILCTLVLLTLQDKNYINFVNLMSKLHYPYAHNDKIKSVINDNIEVFEESYINSIGKINKLLEVEDF